MNEMKSVLNMERLVFEKMLFQRKGFKNENQISFSIETRIAQMQEDEIYLVTLILTGDKEDEYELEIVLTGYFTFDNDSEVDEEMKKALVNTNTIAIMMPYMRSQLSLLTAQPGTESVVLPVFNINRIVNGEEN